MVAVIVVGITQHSDKKPLALLDIPSLRMIMVAMGDLTVSVKTADGCTCSSSPLGRIEPNMLPPSVFGSVDHPLLRETVTQFMAWCWKVALGILALW